MFQLPPTGLYRMYLCILKEEAYEERNREIYMKPSCLSSIYERPPLFLFLDTTTYGLIIILIDHLK